MLIDQPEILPDHTRLSASGAERWMACPGSQVLYESLGLEGEESTFAAEGTAAHELAANCLMDKSEAWEHLDEVVYDHEVSEDMSLAVQVYLDYCRAAMRKYPDADIQIETRIDNRDIHPDFGGTSDFTIVSDRIIIVIDYKHGVGIAKDAEDNPQIMYYALGAYRKLTPAQQKRIQTVRYVIVQPRAFHPDGIIRVSGCEIDELIRWGDEDLFPAMDAVDEPNAKLKAGEHCRFCPGKLGCPVMKDMFQAAASAKAEDAKVSTDDELGLEFELIPAVKIYLSALQKEAYARATKGKIIPGGKMVRGRADRVWKDGVEEKLEEKYGSDMYAEQKAKSPAQIAKMLGGKKFVSSNAYKPEGKLSFVPLDHKSPAVKVETASSKFKGIKKGKRDG